MPSRSYCRRVCACMPASWAATEMTKTGASSSGANPPIPAVTSVPSRALEQLGAPVVSGILLAQGLDGPARLVGQLLGYDDAHLREQVAVVVLALDPPPLDPQHPPAGRAGRDTDLDRLAGQGGDRDRRPEGGLGEGDRQVDGEVVAVAAEDRVRLDVDRQQQVPGRGTLVARAALAAQPDLLAVLDARRDAGRDAAAVAGRQRDGVALDRLPEAQRGAGGDVGAGTRAGRRPEAGAEAGLAAEATATAAAPEHAAEDVLEVGLGAAAPGPSAGVEADVAAAAEEVAEEGLEPGAAPARAAGGEPGAAVAHRADRVVLLAFL